MHLFLWYSGANEQSNPMLSDSRVMQPPQCEIINKSLEQTTAEQLLDLGLC